MAKKIYFLSDAHLGAPNAAESRIREKNIVSFLRSILPDTEALFVVGDLFDFWYEYKTVVPKGYVRVLAALAEFSDQNIPVYFFTGNHDMWMKSYFQEELGVQVFHTPQNFQLQGKNVFVAHGDGLGPGDHGYKFIKKIFRNPICQWLFGALHPSIGMGIANFLSRRSRATTGQLDAQFLGPSGEWLIAYVQELIEANPHDYCIFGHRHLPIDWLLTNSKGHQSRYINLGDWIRYHTYAVLEEGNFHLRQWQKNEAKPDVFYSNHL